MTINEQRIREFAYQIWESEGCPHGQSQRHWDMAYKLADAELVQAEPAQKNVPINKTKHQTNATADVRLLEPNISATPKSKTSKSTKNKSAEINFNELKSNEAKTEEVKAEEVKAKESKPNESIAKETKPKQTKPKEVKSKESKTQEIKFGESTINESHIQGSQTEIATAVKKNSRTKKPKVNEPA